MIKQGSSLADSHIWFKSDKNQHVSKVKSEQIKKQRKNKHQKIRNELENE